MLEDARKETESGTKLTLILALAYSGKDEIVRGVKKWIAEG